MYAPIFQLNWRAQDLPTSTSTSPSSSSLRTATVSPTRSTTPTQTPSNGLSGGAKAGIGVGVAVAGLGVIAALALRHRRPKLQPYKGPPDARSPELHEREKHELSGQHGKSELARQGHELPS
jgi:hypothetical protein